MLILQDANVCSPAEGLILVYFVFGKLLVGPQNLQMVYVCLSNLSVFQWDLTNFYIFQWPFQDPRLEVPTIYKALYGTVPPF